MDNRIEQVAQQVDALAVQIRDEGLATAFTYLDQAIAAFEQEGLNISTILPSEAVRTLGAVTRPMGAESTVERSGPFTEKLFAKRYARKGVTST